MSLLRTADGQSQEQCDGCGRTDAGPGSPLTIKAYAVNDPNVGSKVTHHYCTHCAGNRNAQIESLEFTWPAVTSTPAPVLDADPASALSAELPAPVDQAIAVAERLEGQSEDQ